MRAAGGREVQQALNCCNESLKLKADQADVLDTRGFVNLRLGKMDDAIKDYDAALKLDPKLPGALYSRGVAKSRKGDKAGGSADISAAKAMKSDVESKSRATASASRERRAGLARCRLRFSGRAHPTANLIANSIARTSTTGDASPTLPATSLITA